MIYQTKFHEAKLDINPSIAAGIGGMVGVIVRNAALRAAGHAARPTEADLAADAERGGGVDHWQGQPLG